MSELFETIRSHFNVVFKEDYLSLTLINSNIHLDIIKEIGDKLKLLKGIASLEIILIECPNFDDELLVNLSGYFSESLKELYLDFSGCESLKGEGFLNLFQKVSSMDLAKLHLDFSQIYEINDIVIEGLTMLLESLTNLTYFYLDLYEIDQVSEDGYLSLAESISHLPHLQTFHLDLSANPYLTEDSLELMFSGISHNVQDLTFRILDIDEIGGGSFYQLSDKLPKMKQLTALNLCISTFQHINPKSIESVIQSISACLNLQSLTLNISNIKLPSKILPLLKIPPNVKNVNLDVSCNSLITDFDIISLAPKLKKNKVQIFSLNVDFCSQVTEDSLEEIIQTLCQDKQCIKINFPDRQYSQSFIKNCIKSVKECPVLLYLNIGGLSDKNIPEYNEYKEKERRKRNVFLSFLAAKAKGLKEPSRKILSLLGGFKI